MKMTTIQKITCLLMKLPFEKSLVGKVYKQHAKSKAEMNGDSYKHLPSH
jgi:hypothetical protein